jgi:hypothetical protein
MDKMNSKKANTTLYVIIGLVIVIVSGFFFMNANKEQQELLESNDVGLTGEISSIKDYINTCLKQSTMESVDEHGLYAVSYDLKRSIEIKMLECVDSFSNYKKMGYEITQSEPVAEVEVNENTVIVTLEFNVDIKKDSFRFNEDEFSYTYTLVESLKVDDGVVLSGTNIITSDNKAEFVLAENTKIYDGETGEAIDRVTLTVVDNNFKGLNNGAVATDVVYQGLPEGAKFDPPMQVSVKLSEKDIEGLNPYTLKLAWYDEANDIWLGYPSTYDDETNSVVGLVDHFSYISIAVCTPGISDTEITIPVGTFYEDPFIIDDNPNWCEKGAKFDDYWKENEGKSGYHLHPEYMVKKEDFDSFCMEKPKYYNQKDDNGYYDNGYYTDMKDRGLFPEDSDNPFSANYDETSPKWDPRLLNVYEMQSFYGPSDLSDYVEDGGDELCKNIKEKGLDDWNNDDQQKETKGQVVFYKHDSTPSSSEAVETSGNPLEDQFKQDCLNACAAYARNELSSKFEWFDTSYQSQDSIKDGAVIGCTLNVGTTEVQECLVLDKYNNLYDDSYKIKSKFIEILKGQEGFFASPKTYGIETLENLKGQGRYTFSIGVSGRGCGLYQNGYPLDDDVIKEAEKDTVPYTDRDWYKDIDNQQELIDENSYAYLESGARYEFAEAELEEVDEYCTDNCKATLNDKQGFLFDQEFFMDKEIGDSENSNPSKTYPNVNMLRGGTNTISANVQNIDDLCMGFYGTITLVGSGMDIYEPDNEISCENDFNSCWADPESPLPEFDRCILLGTQATGKNGMPWCCVPGGTDISRYDYSYFREGTCADFEYCLNHPDDEEICKPVELIDECEFEIEVDGNKIKTNHPKGETIAPASGRDRSCCAYPGEEIQTHGGPCACEGYGPNRVCMDEDNLKEYDEHHSPAIIMVDYDCDLGEFCYIIEITEEEEDPCQDPDRDEFGAGQRVQTTVTWSRNGLPDGSLEDECVNDYVLSEAVCSERAHFGVYETINCPEGTKCDDGACVDIPFCESDTTSLRGCQDVECSEGFSPTSVLDYYCSDGVCCEREYPDYCENNVEIVEECMCDSPYSYLAQIYSEGYCCDGTWQSEDCAINIATAEKEAEEKRIREALEDPNAFCIGLGYEGGQVGCIYPKPYCTMDGLIVLETFCEIDSEPNTFTDRDSEVSCHNGCPSRRCRYGDGCLA